ncbi:MAG: hypothetical protein NTZ05_05115, partial [Chloroflexi bacterium]|nr:hypothetical protein [Chloroflexota bacterium]
TGRAEAHLAGTAARILQDPAYKVTELINPIVVLPGRQFRIKFYQLRRADIERRRDFAEIPFTEVPPEHPAVRAFFELQERRRLGQQAPAAGIDTSAVQRRLTDEESELRSRRYTVRTTRLGDQFVFEASSTQQSDRKVFVLCPSNYPASAPQVRLEVGGQEVEHDSRILPRCGGGAGVGGRPGAAFGGQVGRRRTENASDPHLAVAAGVWPCSCRGHGLECWLLYGQAACGSGARGGECDRNGGASYGSGYFPGAVECAPSARRNAHLHAYCDANSYCNCNGADAFCDDCSGLKRSSK